MVQVALAGQLQILHQNRNMSQGDRWKGRLSWPSQGNKTDEGGQQKKTFHLRSSWSLWLIYLVVRNWACCWGPSGHLTSSQGKNGSFPMAVSQPLPDRHECSTIAETSFTFSPITHGEEDLLAQISIGFVSPSQSRRSLQTCRTTHWTREGCYRGE